MKSIRLISRIITGTPSVDGAGVKLTRLIGFHDTDDFDPFLLLDRFGSDNPDDYIAGFPWHPHRGMETVTVMLAGEVEHGDSLGNAGLLGPGDVQWMTAGSGIIHQEMPRASDKPTMGFQFWVNLPARDKMCDPRYQDVPAGEIPTVTETGVTVRVLAGSYGGVFGPVHDIAAQPLLLHVTLDAGISWNCPVPIGHTCFAAIAAGDMFAGDGHKEQHLGGNTLGLFGDGSGVSCRAGDAGVSFVLAAGMPLREPIAWGGPIVMNTQEELDRAFAEFHAGTFVKVGRHPR